MGVCGEEGGVCVCGCVWGGRRGVCVCVCVCVSGENVRVVCVCVS